MNSASVRVLLVEDDAGDARLIQEYISEFGRDGFFLERVGTLRAALERAPDSVDVILLDMNLPDSEGLSLVAAILRRFPDAAVTVLTGQDESSLAAGAVRAGAQDYIVKGKVTGDDLVAAIRRAIANKRQQDLERLRERETLQKEFIANVSHEFRTPLAAIKGAVEILQNGKPEPRKQAQFLDMIARHAERLASLVEDVLMISSLDAAEMEPSLRPVALKPAIDRCLSELAVMASRGKISIHMDVPADLRVRADEGHLTRVLDNLCANAVEYNRPGGEVSVSARAEGGEAVVCVKDTGLGIPRKELGTLFDQFHHTAKERGADRPGGTGLGLMIVKRLIEGQSGRIWAESREGEGSMFRFTLPLA